jgi:hypothetical protein
LGEVAALVLADNPALRAETERVITRILKHVDYLFEHGSSADRNAFTRQVVPVMLRGMQTVEATAADEEMRRAWDEMKSMLRGEAP